jgi:hypothetical protein
LPTYEEKLQELQRLRSEVRRLERAAEAEAKSMQPLTEADERRMTDMQTRADSVYMAASRRAPPPHAYERPDEYRRRLIDGLKVYSPTWQKADLQTVPEDALAVMENQIYADAAANAKKHGLQARQIRPLPTRTASGHEAIEYVGGDNAWFGRQFERPARRAVFQPAEAYTAMARDAAVASIAHAYHRPLVQAPRASF